MDCLNTEIDCLVTKIDRLVTAVCTCTLVNGLKDFIFMNISFTNCRFLM
jgi:hypothetical protein